MRDRTLAGPKRLALLLACLPAALLAGDDAVGERPVSLAELAVQADVVVLAQARDTDYVYRRDFPVRGSAYLRVLIPYKLDPPADLIEVYEEGLHEHECYFPNPTVFEEGRRYLLFLRQDPGTAGRYRGLPAGCALDVLVNRANHYAVRIPVTGITLTDPLADLSEPMTFSDAYANVDEESLAPADRDAWLAAGWLQAKESGYVYTRGVPLPIVREQMGPGLLDTRKPAPIRRPEDR